MSCHGAVERGSADWGFKEEDMRSLLTVVLLGALVIVGQARAQSPHTPSQGGHGGAGHLAGPGHGGGHGAGHGQGHLEAQRYAEQFAAVVREGRGFGMAFAADQNGYPGPMHILELREALRLTAEQEARARSLMEAMFAESRPKGAALLAAEERLRALFRSGTATEAGVRAQVAEIERLRAELRLVHLLTHLRSRDLLSEEQRAAYHALRWGAAPPGR
jgi:Spy/CpxP family protein refolding chaperone